MGLDWDRVAGQGGAYLVERAAAVQQSGRLSPLALALVEEEARRLKYILDEEIGRLQPTAELTPAAIEALRAMYQDRLDKAEHVLETARVTATRPQPPSQPQPPPQPSPASGGGRIVGSGGVGATPPTQPSAAGGAGGNVASGGGETRGRSFREFIAERSILILSYIGAFLLIVATLLFELDTFVALNGTARFIGVLALNVVFAVAGWICFRLPVMRLVGRTYIAIAALMFPLTLIAAWVFLLLADYGIHRDVAVALPGTACALVYGLLAVVLGSRGYSLLSLIALAVAGGA